MEKKYVYFGLLVFLALVVILIVVFTTKPEKLIVREKALASSGGAGAFLYSAVLEGKPPTMDTKPYNVKQIIYKGTKVETMKTNPYSFQLTSTGSPAGSWCSVSWELIDFDFTKDFRFTVCGLTQLNYGIKIGVGGNVPYEKWENGSKGFLIHNLSTSDEKSKLRYKKVDSDVDSDIALPLTNTVYKNVMVTQTMEVRNFGGERKCTIFYGDNSAVLNSTLLTNWVPGKWICVSAEQPKQFEHLITYISLEYI